MIPAASSSRKRARVPTTGAGDGGGGGEGRLGELPDELLLSILSCLTTRQAVQTSVLSRRWRHLWRSTPRFDVDLAEFARPPPSSAPWLLHGRGSTDPWERLRGFTARLLMYHAAPVLDAFRLRVATPFHRRADVESWVRRGIRRRPAALELAYELPHLGSSSSCRLKSRFAEHLRAGCPVLEYLELAYCRTEFSHIRSGTLKNLAIEYCSSRSIHSLVIIAPRPCVYSFGAPRLASLRLDIPYYTHKNGVLLNGANSLVGASVSVIPCQISPEGQATLL
ncbi:hypothetical protein DAI22_04g140033 [Oryza sativa Japonica Group]|nr:hypothetical protein DAI22_04g140033 [Oryza sativa Japonica Group]